MKKFFFILLCLLMLISCSDAVNEKNYVTFESNEPFTLTPSYTEQNKGVWLYKYTYGAGLTPTNLDGVLQYSTDKINWKNFDPNAVTTASSALSDSKHCLYVRGKNNIYLAGPDTGDYSTGKGWSINASSDVSCYGNIMTLLDYENPKTILNADNICCFDSLFLRCDCLADASKLILMATTLSENCYSYMFGCCTNLKKAPVLPSTVLAEGCYGAMFYGCSSLENAPVLPATELSDGCYSNMFDGCSSLKNAPELPSTTLSKSCYSCMFKNCSSLVKAPELPALNINDFCYAKMFLNCFALEKVPALPAKEMASWCYVGMFENCKSLTSSANSTWSIEVTTPSDLWNYQMFDGFNMQIKLNPSDSGAGRYNLVSVI